MMLFFTADLHFGDNETIERESRPFTDVSEFEETIVSNVNKVASSEDILYVLGDWINYNCINHPDLEACQKTFEISKRMNPKVILVIGNNEERIVRDKYDGDFQKMRSDLISRGFEDVIKDGDIEINGEPIHLIHCPVDRKEGVINLFGHTHRWTGLWKPFGLNVGTDLNFFRPFSEKDIIYLLEHKRDWCDKDANCHCM